MKSFLIGLCAAALVAASPAWADRGHGHDKHADKHAEKMWKKERKAWEKAHKHWAKNGHYREHDQIVHHYYYPATPVVERYYVEPVPYSPPAHLQFFVNIPLN